MWYYQDNPVSSIENLPNHEELVGFAYRITNLVTGKIYVGKKSVFTTRKKRISQKEKKLTKTRKIFKVQVKESDWMEYYGSSEELLSDLKAFGPECFRRDILELCYSKKYLGYCELKHQILNNVLEEPSYNSNILGRYFSRDIQKPINHVSETRNADQR